MPSLLTPALADDGMATFRANGADALHGPLVRLLGPDGHGLDLRMPERRDVPGVARLSWRVDGGDVRVALARVADAAVVWRVEVTGGVDGWVATGLEIADPAFGSVRRLPGLGAVVAEGAGVVLAHTFVPDVGVGGAEGESHGGGFSIARTLRLEPGMSAGFTAVVAAGDSERAALEALFPFLSGDRSRDALRTAHREALARAEGTPGA